MSKMSDITIRAIQPEDVASLYQIHRRFYASEFDFPDFIDKYLCVFTIEDSKGIISAGGVRTIAESVIITDQDRPVKTRVKALNRMLEANEFVCRHFGYRDLHAFIQDDKWKQQLLKSGFAPTKGEALVTNF